MNKPVILLIKSIPDYRVFIRYSPTEEPPSIRLSWSNRERLALNLTRDTRFQNSITPNKWGNFETELRMVFELQFGENTIE